MAYPWQVAENPVAVTGRFGSAPPGQPACAVLTRGEAACSADSRGYPARVGKRPFVARSQARPWAMDQCLVRGSRPVHPACRACKRKMSPMRKSAADEPLARFGGLGGITLFQPPIDEGKNLILSLCDHPPGGHPHHWWPGKAMARRPCLNTYRACGHYDSLCPPCVNRTR